MKKFIYSMALLMGMMTFAACSSDSDNNNDNGDKYKDRTYGMSAINACGDVVTQLEAANATIASSKLTEAQETYLRQVLENLVSNVIVPTYTKLADETEALEKTLNGLTVSTITQAQINSACDDFKQARKYWEQSEAFLMGAASDFDVDPTIDSWPEPQPVAELFQQWHERRDARGCHHPWFPRLGVHPLPRRSAS